MRLQLLREPLEKCHEKRGGLDLHQASGCHSKFHTHGTGFAVTRDQRLCTRHSTATQQHRPVFCSDVYHLAKMRNQRELIICLQAHLQKSATFLVCVSAGESLCESLIQSDASRKVTPTDASSPKPSNTRDFGFPLAFRLRFRSSRRYLFCMVVSGYNIWQQMKCRFMLAEPLLNDSWPRS